MDFCYIAPINYLHLVPQTSRRHLILAHLLDRPDYVSFYKKRRERGDVIICDNGAFELGQSLPPDQLLQLIDDSGIKPQYVVAPDYPGQPWYKTYTSTFEFIEQVERRYSFPYTTYKPQIMAVPQSEVGDADGWLKGYRMLCNLDQVGMIGMSILGIPNAFCELTGTKDIVFNRLYASQLIRKLYPEQRVLHHYLGLGNGPRELLLQRQIGLITSNDSSSVFWHAINGIEFDDSMMGLKDGKISKEVDFDLPYDSKHEELILANIKYMQENILGTPIKTR